jgi:hypothetical protein
MGHRLAPFAALLLGICHPALAQEAPPADSEDANVPVMLGLSTPTGKACSFTAKPGEAGYCLRPVDGMDLWLRADDIWARVTILTAWKSPPPLRLSANSSQSDNSAGWRMADQIAGSPAARLGETSALLLSAPNQYQDFTLFAVARQVPGARSGNIISSSRDEAQSIGWSGNAVVLRDGADNAHTLPFPAASEFHVLTVHSERGYATVFANGQPLHESALPLRPFAVQFIGNAPTGAPVNPLSGFRGLRAPTNPTHGSDLAELVIWPRALNEEEMRATLRYLRRKYALPFAPPAIGVMMARQAPAGRPGEGAIATAAGAADELPLPGSARDPLANYPASVGRQFSRTTNCSLRPVAPGTPGYCLWPVSEAVAWHRSDDVFSTLTRVPSWDSPIHNELTTPDDAHQPQQVRAQFGRHSILRFDDERRMDFRKPLNLERYTIFVVGRRPPSAAAGSIFSMGAEGASYLFWHQSAGLVFGKRGGKEVARLSYPDQDKFHLLTLQGDQIRVKAYVNGRYADVQPMPVGTGPVLRVGHVGGGLEFIQSREQALIDVFKDGFSWKATGARISSEIAEILIYDRQLDAAETEITERYFRKKYGLP